MGPECGQPCVHMMSIVEPADTAPVLETPLSFRGVALKLQVMAVLVMSSTGPSPPTRRTIPGGVALKSGVLTGKYAVCVA